MNNAWTFAITNPGYTFLIIWVLCWTFLRTYNRTIRAINIRKHGWPTAPIDADGDVVSPEKDT